MFKEVFEYRPFSKYGQGLDGLSENDPLKRSSRRKLVTRIVEGLAQAWRLIWKVLKGSNVERKLNKNKLVFRLFSCFALLLRPERRHRRYFIRKSSRWTYVLPESVGFSSRNNVTFWYCFDILMNAMVSESAFVEYGSSTVWREIILDLMDS